MAKGNAAPTGSKDGTEKTQKAEADLARTQKERRGRELRAPEEI